MLEDTLGRIGIHRIGATLDLEQVRDSFSSWLSQQAIVETDFAFTAALVGAFISEYLIQRGATRHVQGSRVMLRIPFTSGILREFDPYAAAVGIVKAKSSLSAFLLQVCT